MTAGPIIISNLWGAWYYKEVRGKRNVMFLSAAVLCSVFAVIAVSLSKFDL